MTRSVIKLCCHATDYGVTKLCCHATDPFGGVRFWAKSCHTTPFGVTAQFGHAAVGNVTTQFDHATGDDVTKGVRIENKVKKRLSLK